MTKPMFRAWDGKEMYYIDDLYWFEAEGVHDFGGEGNYGNKFILMKPTSLHDKNGTEIWEKDFVKTPAGIGVVFWDAGVVFLEWPNDGGRTTLFDTYPGHREVLGNIHENPEFLK